jgi:hypothetical protein
MSTRKLILLALACGLAILLAGGIKLFQVAGNQPQVAVLALGSATQIGDATVTVHRVDLAADLVLVDVELGGLDGVDAAAGWVMLADGERREPVALPSGRGVPCSVTIGDEPVRCTVAFASADRVQAVAYARGGEQRQWSPVGAR